MFFVVDSYFFNNIKYNSFFFTRLNESLTHKARMFYFKRTSNMPPKILKVVYLWNIASSTFIILLGDPLYYLYI